MLGRRLGKVVWLFAAAVLWSSGPAKADLIITFPPAGTPVPSIPGNTVAQLEPALDGSPGFPLGLPGFTNALGSRTPVPVLVAGATGTYLFTFEGAGNATNINTFTSLGHLFIANPPGATGSGSTPDGTSFSEFLTAGTPISFQFASNSGCVATDGVVSPALGCSYLTALSNGQSGPSQTTAWIGFSDGATPTDADCQDLVVRVTEVPEPATLLLLGFGLAGLAGVTWRRHRSE